MTAPTTPHVSHWQPIEERIYFHFHHYQTHAGAK